jgi:hypothetical protein
MSDQHGYEEDWPEDDDPAHDEDDEDGDDDRTWSHSLLDVDDF